MAVTTDLPDVGSNLTDFSVDLSVQSLNPGNLDGGTGGITLNTGFLDQPQLLRNTRFTVADDELGSFIGRISDVQWGSNPTQLLAESMLNRLNVEVTIRPQTTDLDVGMDLVLAAANMTSMGLGSASATFPGWKGLLWDYLKHFCAVYNVEMLPHSTNADIVVFRAIRGQIFQPQLSGLLYTVNDQQLAQNIVVETYSYGVVNHPSEGTYLEFTPVATENMQILSVNAGETISYEVQLNAWVTAVNQPVAVDLVGPEERTDLGAYCVAGADGLPVTAAQWMGQGGKLVVSLTDDPSVLKVEVTAPPVDMLLGTDGGNRLSPYSIAAASGDSTLYNSLHITGVGLHFNRQELTLPTGVNSNVTIEEIGVTVDNPWISNTEKAYDIGVRAAQAWAGPTYTFSEGTTSKRHALRDVVGARFNGDNVKFRIEAASGSSAGIRCAGISDTTFEDFNTSAAGLTFIAWAAATTGLSFDQWATIPLKVS